MLPLSPELLELILMNLDATDKHTLKTVFAGRRSCTLWHDLVDNSKRLQESLYLSNEPQDRRQSNSDGSSPSPERVCIHDVQLRPNPVIPETVPGFNSLEVDCDEWNPVDDQHCRRWHFAMQLDPQTIDGWAEAREKNASWRGLLLTQPACKTVVFNCMPVKPGPDDAWDPSGSHQEKALHNADGVTLGQIADLAHEIKAGLDQGACKVDLFVDSRYDEDEDADGSCSLAGMPSSDVSTALGSPKSSSLST